MGSITKRTNPSGEIVYRAQIRINKIGYPPFSESRTFSKKSLATEWLKRREAEIERQPEILYGNAIKHVCPTLREATERYLAEHESTGRSKTFALRFLKQFPIGEIYLDCLKRTHFTEHVMMRRRGTEHIPPIAASTALQELQYIRTILKHAFYVLGLPVAWQELDFAVFGLRQLRVIAKSSKRDRLPTSQELQQLTNYFYHKWHNPRHTNHTPMHLIMWLAIYTARREAELCRMMLDDWHDDEWLIRDVKHPNGSVGNHKYFAVHSHAKAIIAQLLQPEIQQRMKTCQGVAGSLIPLQPESISAAFTRACKMCGIEDLRFHDLRHEAATRLAEDGFTIPQIQAVTLHDSWGSLQRYVNPRRRADRLDFAEAIEKAAQSGGLGSQ